MPAGPRAGADHGRYNKITTETKNRLVAVYENNEDFLAAARALGIKAATARSIILRYRETRSVENTSGGRRPESVKLTEEVAQNIVYDT